MASFFGEIAQTRQAKGCHVAIYIARLRSPSSAFLGFYTWTSAMKILYQTQFVLNCFGVFLRALTRHMLYSAILNYPDNTIRKKQVGINVNVELGNY